MGRDSTVALLAAMATLLETRRMFVAWKAKVKKTYEHVGEEECRYAVFKDTRREIARARAAGPTSKGLNGFAATPIEEFNLMLMDRGDWEGAYEEETCRMFVRWKARYGNKTYRDVGEEACRYWLFKGNRRVVVRLNTAAGRNVYGLNQFGDLTNEEVRERCYPKVTEGEPELSARCQADPDSDYERMIWYQVCRCIARELKETESGGIAIPGDEAPGDEAHMLQYLKKRAGLGSSSKRKLGNDSMPTTTGRTDMNQ